MDSNNSGSPEYPGCDEFKLPSDDDTFPSDSSSSSSGSFGLGPGISDSDDNISSDQSQSSEDTDSDDGIPNYHDTIIKTAIAQSTYSDHHDAIYSNDASTETDSIYSLPSQDATPTTATETLIPETTIAATALCQCPNCKARRLETELQKELDSYFIEVGINSDWTDSDAE